jgi:hypothetical protein
MNVTRLLVMPYGGAFKQSIPEQRPGLSGRIVLESACG